MTATVDNAVADLQRVNADLQRRLDEAVAERDEALRRETATAEVLQVINSSPGDLAPVFDAMLEKARTLCDAATGALFICEGEQFRAVAMQGGIPAWHDRMRVGFRGSETPASAPLLAGESFVHIADMAQIDHPTARAAVEAVGVRTFLSVPLRKDDALCGMIVASRPEVRSFTDKQITLLQNFAAQAVIAMENARLITETREALEQQTATAEVLGIINSSPGDLAPVFDAILEKAHALCGAASGALTVFEGEEYRAVAIHAEPKLAEYWRQLGWIRAPAGEDTLFAHLRRGELIHIPDVSVDDDNRKSEQYYRLIELSGARSLIVVPLRKDDVLLGAITAFRTEVRPFSDKQIALLENFAAQAVIAMENARLITDTREALEQQTATAEVLGVINSSPGDPAPVFDAILEKAHSLCGVAIGALSTYDGEHFRAVATRGFPEQFEGVVRQPFRGNAHHAQLVQGERYVHIPDMLALASELDDPVGRSTIEHTGIRTVLLVPLRKDGRLVGQISADRLEVRPFSDREIALLENFAAQAVIAMENARLLGELRERTEEVAGWNRELEARVAAQLAEIERTGKLRRFLAPQLADLIVAQGDESILESHRREIVVVFCDLRGFTGFAERAEPEEVMALLRDYHAAMGPIVAQYEGTIDHYGGDGIMVFFNDPLPTPDPARRAIDMAVAMRAAAQDLLRTWRRHGHDIGFGVGISQGYATLGQIGFAERMDYTAIGTVTNLTARLCAEAKDGQILVSRRVAIAVEDSATLEEIGDLSLKGLSQAVAVYNVIAVGAQASAS